MASVHPRVQVTVDPELAAAMNSVDAHPRSRSRLIRDLAVRGPRQSVTRAAGKTRRSSTC
jgi:hypothetical protein